MPWNQRSVGHHHQDHDAEGPSVGKVTGFSSLVAPRLPRPTGPAAISHEIEPKSFPQEVVHTGDVILLGVRKADGSKCLLAGDGVVVEDVHVFAFREGDTGMVPDVRECLFRIVQQLYYTALKELLRHRPGKDGDSTGADQASLLEKVRQENSQNEARTAMRTPVRYGDIVQLQHIKSGKYLTVVPKQTAPKERDARRVALQQGGAHSAFLVQAFYKYKAVGEPLLFNEQVIFSSQKLGPRWLLHASLQENDDHPSEPSSPSAARPHFEVNCSTDMTGCFFPLFFARGSDHLQFSHVVRISYPQCDRVLGASCTLGKPKRPFFRCRDGEKLWAKGVWLLETPELLRGGNARWGSQGGVAGQSDAAVCLRHLGTGLYLSVDLQSKPQWHEGSQPICCSRLVKDPDNSCHFLLDVLEDGTQGDAVQLNTRGSCKALLRFVQADGGSLWLSCEPTHLKKVKDRRPRPSLELYFAGQRRIRDAVIIESLSLIRPKEVADITTILGWKTCFRRVARRLRNLPINGTESMDLRGHVGENNLMKEASENDTRELFQQIHESLVSAIRFILGCAPHEAEDPLAVRTERSSPEAQRLVRELKLVDASVVLMDALQDAGYRVIERTSRTVVRLETVKCERASVYQKRLAPVELRCLKLLIELWRVGFQHSRDSENYFFRQGWLDKINDLNGLGLGAATCLSTLVSNNKNLLVGVKVETLQKFVDFIHELGPDATWLRFMQAVCSVEGQAIANKQQLVLQMIYYPGAFAKGEEWEKWGCNRKELLLAVKLSGETKAIVPASLVTNKGGDYPGMTIAHTGIRDVLVSWTTSKDPWQIGCGWLYFHPSHLELPVREVESTPDGDTLWVSLSDIAWVLNPDHTYAAVHPNNPEGWRKGKATLRQQGTFKAKEVLARYLVAQIDVMKEMCTENQVNSIRTLQVEYSFDLTCCALWDHSLAPSVRRSFCSLLNSLWVNRHPHLAAQLVPVCHVWRDLADTAPGRLWLPTFELDPGWLDSSHTSPFDRYPSASKFNVLIAYIRHHLSVSHGRMVHTHKGPVAYTGEVVNLLLNLLRFGFVAEEEQLVSLLRPMVACLDGRTDWLDSQDASQDAPVTVSLPKDRIEDTATSRDDNHTDASMPLLCNHTSCHEPVGSAAKTDPTVGTLPHYFSLPDSDDGAKRYRTGEDGSELVEAKVLMCKVCASVIEIAVGNSVVQLARLFADKNGSGTWTAVSTPAATPEDATKVLQLLRPQQFDFDALSDTNFNILLLDLMMYDSPKLFVAAAEVLQLWNHRIADAFRRAGELIVLGDAMEGEMYREMKCHVARLSDLINTTEDWGVDSALGAINLSQFEDSKRLLEQIRYMCSVGDKNSDSDVPDSRMQSMLSSLRLGEALMQAFDMPFEDFQGDTQGVLTKFMQLVCKLLHQFVSGHPRNQQYFHQHLSKILEWTGRGIDAAHAIASIFRGNRLLCENVSEEIIFEVGQLLVSEQEGEGSFRPQRLDFLQSLIVAGQRPIVRNKEVVLSMLKMPFYSKVLLLFEGDEGADRRGQLLRDFQGWDELEKPLINRELTGQDSEIVYHRSCLSLLAALCVGRDESGASEFVQSKCPAARLVRSYLDVSNIRLGNSSSEDCKNMCFALQRVMLALVVDVYYDTDLKDEVFYSSSAHLVLLEAAVNQLQRLQWDLNGVGLNPNAESFLLQIVHFFSALVEFTPSNHWHRGVEPLLSSRLEPLLTELAKPDYKVRKNNRYFKASVSRTLGWLTQDRESMQQRLGHLADVPTVEDRSNQLSGACHAYLAKLMEQPAIQSAVEAEHTAMIKDVCSLYELTDPADEAYQKEKDAAHAERRRVAGGFRRNPISPTAFVQRAISHCLEGDHLYDWATTSFVTSTVCSMLESQGEDSEELRRMQLICAQAGGERLVVLTLSARPEAEIVRQALRLAEHLLKPNNKAVQEVFTQYFYRFDDSELWRLFREMIDAVSMNVKTVRLLKRIVRESGREAQDVLTGEECEQLHMFSDNVRTLERMLQFLQLLCEGHNSPVQQYVFQQIDNTISVNLLERIKGLCLKICKNEAAADLCDFEELDVLTTCFELLVEATTRPDPRNQLFLSTSGIVEGILKMLNARFALLRQESGAEAQDTLPGDCYPAPVRSLKAQVVLLLLVMLELRPDAEVHQTLVIRTDAALLRRRLVFVHRWFLASQLKLGGAKSPHMCRVEDSWCRLDDMSQDDGVVIPKKTSVELLEDYVEEDLINFFSEAFNIMVMMHQLRSHNAKFKEQLEPSIPDLDKLQQVRMTPDALAQAKSAHVAACKYQSAYHFFNEWIRVIEVSAGGRVYDLYFRMPVLCHFILGSEKAAIISDIPIDPPEAKIKDFVKRCSRLYQMTQHTRGLSKWSPNALRCLKVFNKGRHVRPLLFFMKNDSRNLTRTSYLCMGIALLLNLLLFCGLGLPFYAEATGALPQIMDPKLRAGTWCAGMLYLVLTMIQLLVVGLIYLPIDYRRVSKDASRSEPRRLETVAVYASAVAFGVLSRVMGMPVLFSVTTPFLALLLAGCLWQPEYRRCPQNEAARLLATASAGVKRQQILRRLFLMVMAAGAVCLVEFCYTFLLLDVLFLFEKLQNIIKAVTMPADSLALTMLVGVIVMYIYAVIAFYYFRHDYGEGCFNMVDCTVSTIYLGTREDIGQNIKTVTAAGEDHDYQHWYGRVVFDLSFFILITTVLMNILFGIIVDTFGALRDEAQHRESSKKNTTFISALDRSEIDKAARAVGILSGFDYLENERQNCWNYMFFVFYLRRKDPIQFTGPETLISRLIHEEDISWLPIYNCSLLQRQEELQQMGMDAGGAEGAAIELT